VAGFERYDHPLGLSRGQAKEGIVGSKGKVAVIGKASCPAKAASCIGIGDCKTQGIMACLGSIPKGQDALGKTQGVLGLEGGCQPKMGHGYPKEEQNARQ
jgi:hypothetical protein